MKKSKIIITILIAILLFNKSVYAQNLKLIESEFDDSSFDIDGDLTDDTIPGDIDGDFDDSDMENDVYDQEDDQTYDETSDDTDNPQTADFPIIIISSLGIILLIFSIKKAKELYN